MQENTPFGPVDKSLVEDFLKLSGIKKREDGDWSFLSEEVEGWKLNPHGKDRDRWTRGIITIPIRYYNMQYAMMKSNGNVKEAMKFVRSKLLHGGKPTYLPDQIAFLAGVDNQMEKHYSYGSILRGL